VPPANFISSLCPCSFAALGGQFLNGCGCDPAFIKGGGKPPELAVYPVKLGVAHGDDPAHVKEAAEQVDGFPVTEYFFH
jgi:hypothetical protein